MPPVPAATFADRLQALDHGAVAAFVADLWAASGWETDVEGAVVVAQRDGQRRRLLVLPARRFQRWRSAPSVDDPVDRVVVPRRIEGRDDLPRGTPEAPVIGADDLRRRLCYGVDPEAGDALCRDALGVPLRDQRWADGEADRAVPGGRTLRVGAALALALVAALAVALAAGVLPPVQEDGPAVESAAGSEASGATDDRRIDDAGNQVLVSAAEGVAAGPTVYVGSFVGTADGKLYAVDAETGEHAWTFDGPDAGVFSSPTAVNGTVYVGSVDGTLYAVDGATGETEWTFDDPQEVIWSSPTVVNGTVYVGSDDSTIYAVDADTGVEEWAFEDPDGGVLSSPTVVDGTLYVGSDDGTVYALDAATGERIWAFDDPGRGVYASPTVANGTVYVGGYEGVLYALDAATGDPEWTFRGADSPILASATVVDGTAYVPSENGTVFALDAATGETEWTVGPLPGLVGASVTVANVSGGPDAATRPTAYVVTSNGTAYALDAGTGATAWTVQVGQGLSQSTPTVAEVGGNETLYVGGDDERLHALDAATGERAWTFDGVVGFVPSSPTVVADPAGGDSLGSRVRHRTLGHHDQATDGGTAADEDPEFRVVDLAGPVSVDVGGRARVEATVANVGANGSGTVAWTVDGERVGDADLSLDAGEAATVTLSMAAPEEAGEVAYGVWTPDDGASGTTTALRPASIEVAAVDAPEEVAPGQRLEVETRLFNTGTQTGRTTVTLRIDGAAVTSEEVFVGGSEAENVTLAYEVPDGDRAPYGERTVAVETEGGREERTVLVAAGDETPGFGPLVVVVALAAAAAWRRSGTV